jgi:hypothetical protein
VLPYHAFSKDGTKALPAPQRIMPAPMEAAWAASAQQDKQDMRSVIGMYENSLGLHGQETSGRAILAREKQGDNSVFHFADNLSRAIALTGRIIVELIPHYYDTQRLVTIVGTDDTRSQVQINEQVPGPVDPTTGAIQALVQNNVTEGEYAVTVEAGPSYATKRQETQETLMQVVQSYPPMMQFAGDLLIGAMDFPDSDKLVERFKLMLPANVQQAVQAEEQGQDPQVAQLQQQVQQVTQQAQQALQGMQQQLQQSMQENEGLKQAAKSKSEDNQIKVVLAQMDAQQGKLDAVVSLVEAMLKLQQTQVQPIGPEAVQLSGPAQQITQ